ncbi:MAG TPA: signal peptidase II [Humibacter sp.]|nr:signal peptidase II [Humibacter sp.]
MEARPSKKVSVGAIVLLGVVALVVLTLDQLAKWQVVKNLQVDVPVHVIGDLLIFQLHRNSGAAFSIGTGSTWIFSIIATAVLVFIIWYARRIRSVAWGIVFGLLLGGLLGNLSDRLLRAPGFGVGEVVDFIRIPLLPAIFNLADSAIVAAMILFLVLTVMGVGLDGKRATATKSVGAAEAVAEAPSDDAPETADDAAPREHDSAVTGVPEEQADADVHDGTEHPIDGGR